MYSFILAYMACRPWPTSWGEEYLQILSANHWKLGEHVSVLASLQTPETYVPITQNKWSQSCPPRIYNGSLTSLWVQFSSVEFVAPLGLTATPIHHQTTSSKVFWSLFLNGHPLSVV